MGKRLKTKLMSIMLIITLVPLGACVNTKIVRANDTPTDAELAIEAALLSDAKTDSKANLDNYSKNSSDYRNAEKAQLTTAIDAGKTAIDSATTIEAVQSEETKAKATIELIKTDEEYLQEELAAKKVIAKSELDNYKKVGDYRTEQQQELAVEINSGKEDIDKALVIEDVLTAEATAKDIIDEIKTAAQFTESELTDAKIAAKSDIDTYKTPNIYRSEEQTKLSDAIIACKTDIDNALTVAEVSQKVTNAKTIIDAIKTDAQYLVEEVSTKTPDQMSAEELAFIKTFTKGDLDNYKDASLYRTEQKTVLATEIAAGKTAIDSAKTSAEVNSALKSAKAKIDAIKTDAQLTADENKPVPTGDVSVLPLVAAITIGMDGKEAIKKKKQLM